MQVEKQHVGNVLVMQPLDPMLSARVALSFKETMVNAIREGNNRIILNLSHVKFIDSSGLGAIVSSLKTLGHKGELVLCGLCGPVLELFKLTHMDRVFRILTEEQETLDFLRS
jgi:anti-sigma B factor antagonist